MIFLTHQPFILAMTTLAIKSDSLLLCIHQQDSLQSHHLSSHQSSKQLLEMLVIQVHHIRYILHQYLVSFVFSSVELCDSTHHRILHSAHKLKSISFFLPHFQIIYFLHHHNNQIQSQMQMDHLVIQTLLNQIWPSLYLLQLASTHNKSVPHNHTPVNQLVLQ